MSAKRYKFVLICLGLSVFIAFHIFLLTKTFFTDSAGNIHTTRESYGDIPLHLTQISKFAFGSFNLNDPIYLGEKLHYPFVINLISGLLLRMTGLWQFSVLFPILLFAGANITLCFVLYKKLLKKSLVSFMAVILFFFGGGMAGFSLLPSFDSSSLSGWTEKITRENVSVVELDASYPNQPIDFGSPLTLVFMHQRAFFLGFFVFLLLLLLIEKVMRENSKKRHVITAGILLGALPLLHTHTFIAGVGAVALTFFYSIPLKKKREAKALGYILLIGALFSLPQIIYLLGSKTVLSSTSSFITFRLGWMVNDAIGGVRFPPHGFLLSVLAFLKFLWINFGVILPGLLVSLWYGFKRISKEDSHFWIYSFSALGLFIAVELVQFQPWDFDNNKLLVYYQFFAVPIIFSALYKLFDKKPLWRHAALSVFMATGILTGLIATIPLIKTSYASLPVIFSKDARELADFVRTRLPENELILTSGTHLNPISSLSGRQVLLGYPGWLWTRGIRYFERENEIKKFYADPRAALDLLSNYNIRIVLLDPESVKRYHADKDAFSGNFGIIFQNREFILYETRK